jgi:gliding motility-associated-like protein
MRKYILGAVFLFCYFISNAQTFSYTGTPIAIPGSGTSPSCNNLNVTGVGTIGTTKGLSEVCFTINHTSVDELEILLQAPDGTYVPLTIQNGATGADNYTNTCFSATATSPIKFNSAPFTGTFLPEGHLGAVNNGQNADGVWKLCILDRRAPSNAGTIQRWSLTFSNNPAPQPPAFPNCSNNIPSTSDCASATSICDFNGACGSTTGSIKRSWTALDNASCFGLNNNSFVKFIADAPTVSFSVWVNNSNNGFNNANGGIQMLFFSTPSCGGAVTTYGCYNRIYPYASNGKQLISVVYAEGLTPGNTYYLMTDGANGDLCDFRIAANSGVNALKITPSSQNICVGDSVTLTASGGNGIYTWGANNPNAGLAATTGTVVKARPSTSGTIRYSLTSTTGLGCPTATSIDINVSPQPTAPIATPTQPSCTTPTGSITVTPITGSTYSIDGTNFQTSNIFSGLTPGNYNVKVKNAGGCVSAPTSVTINASPAGTPSYVYSVIDPTCSNPTGGIVIQQPVGNNYEYNINNGTYQSTPSFSNLTSGNYTTTVRDKITGCVSPSSTFTVKPAPVVPVAPTTNSTQPTCSTPTGSITVSTPTGANFEYNLNGGTYQSSALFSNLNPSTYSIRVKDKTSGCESNATSVTINAAPSAPQAPVFNLTQPSCSVSTGSVTITNPTGNNIEYSLNGGTYQTAATFSSLTPGNYSVIVRNSATNCVSPAATFAINAAPSAPQSPTFNITQPTCTTPSGSVIITNPTGNNLEYSLNGGTYQTSSTFNNLTPGNYAVTVRNNSTTCISTAANFTINSAPALPSTPQLNITVKPTCSNQQGTIDITSPTGSSFSYGIDGNYQSSPSFPGLTTGRAYTFTVRNNTTGCISLSSSLNIDPAICNDDLFVPNAFSPNSDGKNDILFVRGSGIVNMQFLVYNQWGEKVFESNAPSTGWNGLFGGKPQPVGVYVYVLRVTKTNGETVNKKGSVTLIR